MREQLDTVGDATDQSTANKFLGRDGFGGVKTAGVNPRLEACEVYFGEVFFATVGRGQVESAKALRC